jgi:hypothetical protein
MKPMDIKERFMRHVNVTLNSCWLWTGQLDSCGYGTFSGTKLGVRAHRISWKLYRGDIDTKTCVLHKCDTRNCVNPDHLFLGTRGDNNKDKTLKNRAVRGEKVFCAKLTEKKVLEIRAANEDWIELAKKYGVSVWTINNIKSGHTWKWLTDDKISEGG